MDEVELIPFEEKNYLKLLSLTFVSYFPFPVARPQNSRDPFCVVLQTLFLFFCQMSLLIGQLLAPMDNLFVLKLYIRPL